MLFLLACAPPLRLEPGFEADLEAAIGCGGLTLTSTTPDQDIRFVAEWADRPVASAPFTITEVIGPDLTVEVTLADRLNNSPCSDSPDDPVHPRIYTAISGTADLTVTPAESPEAVATAVFTDLVLDTDDDSVLVPSLRFDDVGVCRSWPC